ncbi:MAG TPA: PadR family transcriptional regulator [Rhizomicrobium sp.]|nr:PadR family transcriptional regulator [Rhizomicrobium sp.]
MTRRKKLSAQTVAVLQVLVQRPMQWRYGYELSKELALQSGTLYPLLMRLTDAGLLESQWQPPAKPGAPARHAYRLTRSGLATAHAAVAAQFDTPNGALPVRS